MGGIIHYTTNYDKALLSLTCIACAASAVLVISGMAAACELPYPSFCCYTEEFSDRASCRGRNCRGLGVRTSSAFMFCIWCILLFMYFPTGFNPLFLYSCIACMVLHATLVVLVTVQLWVMRAERDLHEQLRAVRESRAAADAEGACLRDIPMQAVELVIVLQPDYQEGAEGGVDRGSILRQPRQGVAFAWEAPKGGGG